MKVGQVWAVNSYPKSTPDKVFKEWGGGERDDARDINWGKRNGQKVSQTTERCGGLLCVLGTAARHVPPSMPTMAAAN